MTQSLIEGIGAKSGEGGPARSAENRWLVLAGEDVPSPIETYRQVYSAALHPDPLQEDSDGACGRAGRDPGGMNRARRRGFGYLRLESAGVLASRFGRRTTLTFPLLPPPQKKRSPPSDSRPETAKPAGISMISRTSPVWGSIRLRSLASPSQVPCQSSPSDPGDPGDEAAAFDACEELRRSRDRSDGSSGPDTAPPRASLRPR